MANRVPAQAFILEIMGELCSDKNTLKLTDLTDTGPNILTLVLWQDLLLCTRMLSFLQCADMATRVPLIIKPPGTVCRNSFGLAQLPGALRGWPCSQQVSRTLGHIPDGHGRTQATGTSPP